MLGKEGLTRGWMMVYEPARILPVGVEARLVERVRQGLDHPAGGPGRQLRVAVQRDDEPDIGQMLRVADVDQTIGIVRPRSIDQTIELFQLPAFALPTDEFLLGFTPGALPMEKEETLTAIPLIESFEALRSPSGAVGSSSSRCA